VQPQEPASESSRPTDRRRRRAAAIPAPGRPGLPDGDHGDDEAGHRIGPPPAEGDDGVATTVEVDRAGPEVSAYATDPVIRGGLEGGR